MFEKLGKFIMKYKYIIIGAWIVGLVLLTIFAPNLSDVATSDQSGYLPEDAPSIIAAKIAKEYFPDQTSPDQAVLVIKNEDGSVFEEGVQIYINDLTNWLDKEISSDAIGMILSPADPDMADQLISEDGQVAMIFVKLNGTLGDLAVDDVVKAMQERVSEPPEGLSVYVTGGAAITGDYKEGAHSSAESTTLITIILVVVVLLIIYRSPVSPFVPLMTISIAYGISRALIALLASYGFVVSSITDIFLIVLLFGAGTDYCLFIVSRFREFMADDLSGPSAAAKTVSRVGETITSSAGTVIVGMVAMSFVQLKIFANAGPSLAVGILVALLAGLTFTPSLLAVLGRWAFWPSKPRHLEESKFWGKLATWVTNKPWVPLILSIVILVPLAVYGIGQERSFDLLADIPDDADSKIGFQILSEHFGAGEMQPLDIIITDVTDNRSPEGLAEIHTLTQDLLAVEGVADVRSLTLPAGQERPELSEILHVDYQLRLMADGIDEFGGQENGPMMSANLDYDDVIDGFETMQIYLDDLAITFPDLLLNPNYQAALNALGSLETNIDVVTKQMLVSNQIAAVSEGFTRTQPGDINMAAMGGMLEQLTLLRAYLTGLADDIPAIADLDGYEDSLSALDAIESIVAELRQMLLVSVQMNMNAEKIRLMTDALASNPMALMPQPGQPAPAEQMTALRMYLEELGTAYPALAATEDYQVAMGILQQMETSFGAMDPATVDTTQIGQIISQAQQGLSLLSDAFARLAATVAETMPEAVFIPQTSLPGADSAMVPIEENLAKLESALESLEQAVSTNLPEATYIPQGDFLTGSDEAQESANILLAEVDAFQAALYNLADEFGERQDNFFIPLGMTEGEDLDSLITLLDTYTTPSGDASRLQIILTDEPFSPEALETTNRLEERITQNNRQGYISGGTATLADLGNIIDSDFVLVIVLVLVGIAVVLAFLLRSLVAPVYLLATILLSYGATMGLIRLVFDSILHTDLTWFVPFFVFVLLVALGMDYNIFLMGRVKEEVATHGTLEGIKQALQRTGGIITSAGIIMAGTFAAMMSSSLLGLKQIAFAITVGILLDTFVIRTTLVPAIAVLLGKWNWWPGKEPGK